MSQKNGMLFKRILEEARSKYNNQAMLIEMEEECKQLGIHDHTLYVLVNSKKLFNFLQDINLTRFNEVATSIYEDKIELKFVEDVTEYEKLISAANKRNEISSSKFDKNLTFSTYVIGEYNKVPVDVLKRIIRDDEVKFNPIFIYGVTGIGKTHLINAFANEYVKNFPERKVKLIGADQFSKEFIEIANYSNRVEEFKRLHSLYDVYIIEDIQFLTGREKSQEVFFTVFENLIKQGSLIIITSDRYNEHLNGFTDRMISRFGSGLTFEMKRPGEEVVAEIVKERSKEAGLKITADGIEFIAKCFSNDIRKSLCIINNLYARTISFGDTKLIDKNKIKEWENLNENSQHLNYYTLNLNPHSIINTVAKFYSLTPNLLTSDSRTKNIMNARSMAMYIMKTKLNLTYSAIGNFFGKKHSTAMNAIKNFEDEFEKNEDIKIALETILKKL